MQWLEYFTLWQSWLGLSMLLFALEILSPTAFFLWPALSAMLLVGLNALWPFSWQLNLLLFSLISVLIAYYLRGPYLNRGRADHPSLNRKSQQLLGQFGWAESLIDTHQGRLKLGDSYWSARSQGPDSIEPGQQAQVVQVDGTLLIVVPVKSVLS